MAVIGNAPALGIITGDNILDGSIKAADLAPGAAVPSQAGNSGKYLTTDGTNSSWGALSVVKITSVTYPGDDLAADPAGGQTITITGSGFVDTPTVYVNDTIAPSVTFVSSTQITITTPAKTAGTYNLYVINTDGSTAIRVMGISYSGTPAWTTPAGSLGTSDSAISIQLEATSNSAVTYTLTSGSSLPSGITLSSSGLVSGTVATDQTFSFSVDATDAENQTTPRSFSVTVSLGDTYFSYVTTLLHGDGTNGAQNNTFVDSSANSMAIARAGNPTQGSFSPYGESWSNYFGGSANISTAANAAFQFGTGDFTLECWINMAAGTALLSFWAAFLSAGCDATVGGNGVTLYIGDASAGSTVAGEVVLNVGSGTRIYGGQDIRGLGWIHVAATRSGTTVRLFVNGVQKSTATNSLNIDGNTYGGSVGLSHSAQTNYFVGYVSNARIVKGTAVYTSNFTPSTSPLTVISGTSLLTCQSNRLKDSSSNAFTVLTAGAPNVTRFSPFKPSAVYDPAVIGGSGYFDGTTDYIYRSAVSSAFAFGQGDFTIEAWAYPTVVSGATYRGIVSTYDSAQSTAGIILEVYAGNWGYYSVNGGNHVSSGVACALNAWTHLALVRSSGTTKLYVNGVVTTSASDTTNCGDSPFQIGGLDTAGSYPFAGYISDVRIAKGAAVYTTAFTPPTTPLTAVAGTQLLCHMTNASIVDSAMMSDFETVGGASVSTSVKKFGSGSLAFNGGGDCLLAANNPNFRFGTGAFTIEFWVYQTQLSGYQTAYSFGYGSSGAALIQTSGNTGKWDVYLSGVLVASDSGPSVSANTWYHIAVVRSGSTVTIYRNGVAVGSGTATTNINNSADQLSIGAGSTYYLYGYLDDLRITKGYARYTGNFTPPTEAFKNK